MRASETAKAAMMRIARRDLFMMKRQLSVGVMNLLYGSGSLAVLRGGGGGGGDVCLDERARANGMHEMPSAVATLEPICCCG